MTANLSSPADAKPQLSTLRRFFGYFAPYRHEIPVALLMVLIGATSQAIGPLLIGWSIDNLILQGNLLGLLRMLAILASIYVVGFGAIRALRFGAWAGLCSGYWGRSGRIFSTKFRVCR